MNACERIDFLGTPLGSERVRHQNSAREADCLERSFFAYFDLRSNDNVVQAESGSAFAAVRPQYATVACGVMAEPFFGTILAKVSGRRISPG